MAGVPKSVVRNVPRYRLGNVPNFQGRNSIQSIILRSGSVQVGSLTCHEYGCEAELASGCLGSRKSRYTRLAINYHWSLIVASGELGQREYFVQGRMRPGGSRFLSRFTKEGCGPHLA